VRRARRVLSCSPQRAAARADICRAILTACVSLASGQHVESDALPRLLRSLVPLAVERTLAESNTWSSPLLRRAISGGSEGDTTALSEAEVPPLSLAHPITGLGETRVLYEYVSWWRELIVVADPATLAALEAVAAVTADGGSVSAPDPDADLGEDGDQCEDPSRIDAAMSSP